MVCFAVYNRNTTSKYENIFVPVSSVKAGFDFRHVENDIKRWKIKNVIIVIRVAFRTKPIYTSYSSYKTDTFTI